MPTTVEEANHSDREHAEFSPSSLKYVGACAGYVSNPGTNAAAERGTRLHEAMEHNDPSALHDEDEVAAFEKCREMEKGFQITAGVPDDAEQFYEIRLNIMLWGTTTFGTCDRLSLWNGRTEGLLADYKFGIGHIDAPEINKQARTYSIGVFQEYPELQKLTFAFYIPARDELLWHTFTREDLPELMADISQIILKGEAVRPMWSDGSTPPLGCLNATQYCRFCKFEDTCPATGALVMETFNGEHDDATTPEEQEEKFNIAKIVKSWAERTIKKTTDQAKDGVEFPNLRLVSMGSTTKCTDSNTLLEVAENLGVSRDEMLEKVSIPLGTASKVIASKAQHGKKQEAEAIFRNELEDRGVLEQAAERFTLK